MTSKATLNDHHSENTIDIFRFCVRKTECFLKALNIDVTGCDLEVEQTFDMAESNIAIETSHVAPQPKFMDVEMHSKIEWLCNRNCLFLISREHLMVWLGMVKALPQNLRIEKVLIPLSISMSYDSICAEKTLLSCKPHLFVWSCL